MNDNFFLLFFKSRNVRKSYSTWYKRPWKIKTLVSVTVLQTWNYDIWLPVDHSSVIVLVRYLIEDEHQYMTMNVLEFRS